MKIWIEKEVHEFPDDNRIIYDENEYMATLFDSIQTIQTKKKNNMKLMDENNEAIDSKEIHYICVDDIALIRQYISMNSKSQIKEYMVNTILENDTSFLSMYKAIELIRESISDSGFVRMNKKILSGVINDCEIKKTEIEVEKLVNFYNFDLEKLTDSEICMIYLNLMSVIHEGKRMIINIKELNINRIFLEWMKKLDDSIQILISNKQVLELDLFDDSFSILSMKNIDAVECVGIEKNHFHSFLFGFLPIATKNRCYLEEKISKINRFYYEKDRNILVYFDTMCTQTTFT